MSEETVKIIVLAFFDLVALLAGLWLGRNNKPPGGT